VTQSATPLTAGMLGLSTAIKMTGRNPFRSPLPLLATTDQRSREASAKSDPDRDRRVLAAFHSPKTIARFPDRHSEVVVPGLPFRRLLSLP